jgi:predicted dehydrogenase
MSAPVRVGILSVAHYHGNFWAEAINESADAALVGIWDDDAARGRAAAERHRTRYWPALGALLRECDGVGITSETIKHAPLVEEAARAGVHVLCEKPLAASRADADRIERAVRAAGITYAQSFPKRFDPINRELVELVRRGDLGEVAVARIRHGHYYGLDPEFRKQWYCDPALAGGGALLDEGIHAADFLLWLLGEPQSVSATTSSRTLGLAVDDTAIALFTFGSGAIAEIATSWTFVAAEQSIEVFGTGGTAQLAGVDLASRDFVAAPYLKVFRHGAPRGTWTASPAAPLFTRGVHHRQAPLDFVASLRTKAAPLLGLAEGRRSLELILAAYAAAAAGRAYSIAAAAEQP